MHVHFRPASSLVVKSLLFAISVLPSAFISRLNSVFMHIQLYKLSGLVKSLLLVLSVDGRIYIPSTEDS